MNKVILIGNLAADPESRMTQSGVQQCTLRLAVQRRFANQQGQREADFFNVVCWRQTAEFAARYLSKGRKIAVEGSIRNRSYTAQDGSKRYVTEINAEHIESIDRAPDTAPQPAEQAPKAEPPKQMRADEFIELPDDDELPF